MPVRRTADGALAVLAFLVLAAPPASGQERAPDGFYCDQRKLGRYFYCRPPEGKKDEQSADLSTARIPTARAEVDAIQAELEELRAEAVLRPTTASVSAYIRFQREQLDRASTFSDVWRRALWADPSLDYNLQRPVSGYAKRAWLDGRKEERAEALAALSERYGLFYFYAASCFACQEFSPVLRAFADRHDLTVKAVSVDGGPSAEFPDAVRDSGQMARMGLGGAPTPSLVLFDTQTRAVTPVAFGLVSQAELEDRIFVLTRTEAGKDY
ncbi:MAG: conjugal transfer protein TraF [Pseudomonadota bacterium]